MEILPNLPSLPATGVPPAADDAVVADDPFLALLVGLLMPASPAPTSAGAAVDQSPTGGDVRIGACLAAGVSAATTEPPAAVDRASEQFAQLVPEVEEPAAAGPEPCASTGRPAPPTNFTQAPLAVKHQPPDQPIDGAAPAVPEVAAPKAQAAAGRSSEDEPEDRKDDPERPKSAQAEPAAVQFAAADAAAPPSVDALTGNDPGQSAANPTITVGGPGGTVQSQNHVAAPQVERLTSTALTIADAQGREVTARLVVSGGADGKPLRIELQPADLGRVEVSLHLHDSGAAAANFTVDRLETLQLLQRDARTVTEMLTAAGFTVDQGSLGFTLRDGGNDRGSRVSRGRNRHDASGNRSKRVGQPESPEADHAAACWI